MRWIGLLGLAFSALAADVSVLSAWEQGDESIAWVQTPDWEDHFYYRKGSEVLVLRGSAMPDFDGGRFFFFDPRAPDHFTRLTSESPHASVRMAEYEDDLSELSYTRVFPNSPNLYALCGSRPRTFDRASDARRAELEGIFSTATVLDPVGEDRLEWVDAYAEREDPAVTLKLRTRVDFARDLAAPTGALVDASYDDAKGSEVFQASWTRAEPETYYRGEWLGRHRAIFDGGETIEIQSRGVELFHDRPYLFFKSKGQKVGRLFDRTGSKIEFSWTVIGPCSAVTPDPNQVEDPRK